MFSTVLLSFQWINFLLHPRTGGWAGSLHSVRMMIFITFLVCCVVLSIICTEVHLISAPQHPASSSPADCLPSPGRDQREPALQAGAGDCPATPTRSFHSYASSGEIETSSTMEWLSITHFRVMILCTDCSISNQMKSTGATAILQVVSKIQTHAWFVDCEIVHSHCTETLKIGVKLIWPIYKKVVLTFKVTSCIMQVSNNGYSKLTHICYPTCYYSMENTIFFYKKASQGTFFPLKSQNIYFTFF